MEPSLSIEVKTMQGRVPVTVFHLKGDIDGNTYESLEKKAEESHQAGARYLLLDLSEVPFVSSAGIRALHFIFTSMRSESSDDSDENVRKGIREGTYKSPNLKLLNPSSNVRNLLDMTGYSMFLEIHRNLKEAVDSF